MDYVCRKCGYQWQGRKAEDDIPAKCPKCRDYKWDQPRPNA